MSGYDVEAAAARLFTLIEQVNGWDKGACDSDREGPAIRDALREAYRAGLLRAAEIALAYMNDPDPDHTAAYAASEIANAIRREAGEE